MPSSFAEHIGGRLEELGREMPLLVREEYDEKHFGDAHAIFELGKLRLHFLNDRGLEAIDVEIPDGHGGYALLPLENLAVAADLLSREHLFDHYGLSETVADSSLEVDPPPGPFLTLAGALGLLGEHWDQLTKACADENVLRRAAKVQAVIHERLADSLAITPGGTRDGPEVGPAPPDPTP